MKIYTLTGPSGTGKSFRAMGIAREKNIDAIIDDGLFIYHDAVIEGESAKKSSTKIGAVKSAIFYDDEKAEAVKTAIREKEPQSILVLGTSDEMADKIIDRLELFGIGMTEPIRKKLPKTGRKRKRVEPPHPEVERIYIEDIASEDERRIAKVQRSVYGKHVIPVPTVTLKKSFAGYFLDSLARIRGKDMSLSPERTVVRPTFSYMGDYILSNRVITDICNIAAKNDEAIESVIMITQEPSPENYKINIAVRLNRGYSVWDSASDFQRNLYDMIEKMTAFNMTEVNVEIRGII